MVQHQPTLQPSPSLLAHPSSNFISTVAFYAVILFLFQHMLRSDRFPESKDNTIRLPKDDVSSFAVFAEYLYVGDECDTGAVLEDVCVKGKSGTPGPKKKAQMTRLNMKRNAAHDEYDFMLQFSCYVLADKLRVPKFKRLMMNEIRSHGGFCDPTNLKMEHVWYVYNNTIRRNDPLRRFCVMVKCKQMPVEETLADAEFINLMEEGGPLVKDIMQACRRQTLKQKEMIEEHEREIQNAKKELKQFSARKQPNPAK